MVPLQLYSGISHAIREMYKENGIRTFYKGEMHAPQYELFILYLCMCVCVGLLPTLVQITPYIALQFGIYTTSVAIWKRLSGVNIHM